MDLPPPPLGPGCRAHAQWEGAVTSASDISAVHAGLCVPPPHETEILLTDSSHGFRKIFI